jgi:hypothetical protein
VDVQRRATAVLISSKKAMNVTELLRAMSLATTSPECTSSAATNDAVPWRTYSNSSRQATPGAAGVVGATRSLAWIPVFSSTE